MYTRCGKMGVMRITPIFKLGRTNEKKIIFI